MLADELDVVIGVDTHKHTHTPPRSPRPGRSSTTSRWLRIRRAIGRSSRSAAAMG
jgi:hypothetical protein